MDHRVFVSSTFVDLKDHREAVRNALRQLGAIDVCMENLGARDERPKPECLRIVSEETDSFVGIYAHRYGFIPPKDKVSITEAEFNSAACSRIPRFIYFLDEETPWNPKLIDSGKPAQLLQKFKKRVSLELICKSFQSRDQLAAFVAADLGRHIAQLQMKRVESSVSSAQPTRQQLKTAKEWNQLRDSIYEGNRRYFLVHTLSPSRESGQLFDIFIMLRKHRSPQMPEVAHAEFFLGKYWGNEVFKVENDGSVIGLSTSAYGEFLCLCRVTFTDGAQIVLERYIDFGGYAPTP